MGTIGWVVSPSVAQKRKRLAATTTSPVYPSRPTGAEPGSALEHAEILREILVQRVVVAQEIGVLLRIEEMHERALCLHRVGETRFLRRGRAGRAQLRQRLGWRALRGEDD